MRRSLARNLYQQGHLTERDWQTYCDLYKTLSILLKPPNLIVYLKASVADPSPPHRTPRARIRARHLQRLSGSLEHTVR